MRTARIVCGDGITGRVLFDTYQDAREYAYREERR